MLHGAESLSCLISFCVICGGYVHNLVSPGVKITLFIAVSKYSGCSELSHAKTKHEN